MTDIKPLTDILDWKLLKGTHKWPGPDGGTCINEAAIVAAGFEYCSVRSAHDCPACFCPVMATYLIALNDGLPANDRQQLMRFVLRLAGSRDYDHIQDRAHYIMVTVNKALGVTVLDTRGILSQIKRNGRVHVDYLPNAVFAYAEALAERIRNARGHGHKIRHDALVRQMLDITENAFAIGKQAEAIDVAMASQRMEEMKQSKKAQVSAVVNMNDQITTGYPPWDGPEANVEHVHAYTFPQISDVIDGWFVRKKRATKRRPRVQFTWW